MLAILIAAVTTVAVPPPKSGYLPRSVQEAIVARLKNEDMALGAVQPSFMRYSIKGEVEAFSCQEAAAQHLYPYHSDSSSTISVGVCAKDSVLNLQYAETQLKSFAAAAGASAESWKKQAPQLFKPVVREGSVFTTIYIPQIFISGVGGMGGHGVAALETVLIVPNVGDRVVIAQGMRPDSQCGPSDTLEACKDFPKLLEEIAELVLSKQLGIERAPN